MVVVICGGGHLGHVCAGVLASRQNVGVRMLTRKPHLWSNTIEVTDAEEKKYLGNLDMVTDDVQKALSGADVVLLCLPGFSIAEELIKLRPFLSDNILVGSIVSSTGFFFRAFEFLNPTQPLFGFQRVPYIARTRQYGHSANLLGYKPSLSVAVEQTKEKEHVRSLLESLFSCPISLCQSHYEVSLTNSNPLLHTSRLYSLWKDYQPGIIYERIPLFYSEWSVEASKLLVAMDIEFQNLLKTLGVSQGAIPTILDYYESSDAQTLSNKLQSISAFQGIESPMKEVEGGFAPDFESRYFKEDFPYGLKIIRDLAHDKNVDCPTIDLVCDWGMHIVLNSDFKY